MAVDPAGRCDSCSAPTHVQTCAAWRLLARTFRLYLVRPAKPIALAIIYGLSPNAAVNLMALAFF